MKKTKFKIAKMKKIDVWIDPRYAPFLEKSRGEINRAVDWVLFRAMMDKQQEAGRHPRDEIS